MNDKPTIGHNSVSADVLRDFLERYESLDAEKREASAEQREIRNDLKAHGYDLKAFAEIVRRRKKKRSEIQEHLSIVEVYEQALGIFS